MVREITTIEDFYKFLQERTDTKDYWDYIYRGVSSSKYELKPSIGRIRTYKKEKELNVGNEMVIFNDFKNRAYPYIKDYNFNTLELLSFGRHHGLPTRLLDWTQNLMVAIYFAVEQHLTDDKEDEKKEEDIHSCIYIHKAETPIEPCEPFDPFTINCVRYYLPKHLDSRLIAQGGLFTVHNEPYTPWNPDGLETVFIHKKIRGEIKILLNKLGINANTLSPDIDGIAKYVEWKHSNLF